MVYIFEIAICNTKEIFKSNVFAFIFAYALINKNENKYIHSDTGRIVKSQCSRLLHTVYFIYPLGRNIYIRYLNLILLCIKYFQCRVFVQLVRWPPRSRLVSGTPALLQQCRKCRWVSDIRYPSSHHWIEHLHDLVRQTQLCRIPIMRNYSPQLSVTQLSLMD